MSCDPLSLIPHPDYSLFGAHGVQGENSHYYQETKQTVSFRGAENGAMWEGLGLLPCGMVLQCEWEGLGLLHSLANQLHLLLQSMQVHIDSTIHWLHDLCLVVGWVDRLDVHNLWILQCGRAPTMWEGLGLGWEGLGLLQCGDCFHMGGARAAAMW